MASLDMTLDDMIKSRRNTERGGRGQGRARRGRGGSFRGGRTTGAPRRGPLGVNARPSANRIAKSSRRTKNLPWQNGNGLFEDSLRAAGISSGLESGTKVYVSNLDAGVTNSDIRELFSEIGELIRYAIHYDKNGRPSGAAEVVFARRSDAYQAHKRYNNVQLDGKPMKIEVVAPSTDMPLSARVDVGGRGSGRRTVVTLPGSARGRGAASAAANRGSSQRGRGGFGNASGRWRNRGRGGGRGRGRGRGGRGRKNGVEKSAEELDKELEKYHATADAMQT